MTNSPVIRSILTVIIAIATLFSGPCLASGDDALVDNAFAPNNAVPPKELVAYAHTAPGVIVPSYAPVYHYVAYRLLTGHPLSKSDLALLDIQNGIPGVADAVSWINVDSDRKHGSDLWLEARRRINGAADVVVASEVEVENYSSILNCHQDAWETAAKTLDDRLKQGGQKWAAVWLAGQDEVFRNCGPVFNAEQKKKLPARPLFPPPDLPAGSPAWLVKDHAYQHAAALFYSGRYEAARSKFLNIANDKESPWQPLGTYLAARCLIRMATTMSSNLTRESHQSLLERARNDLVASREYFPRAQTLLHWIDYRLRPEALHAELAAKLKTGKISPGEAVLLSDYLGLFKKFQRSHRHSDDMSLWITQMQSAAEYPVRPPPAGHKLKERLKILTPSRSRWKKQHEIHWLLALVSHAKATELEPDETTAAMAVAADSPAYVGIRYHLARLAFEAGENKEANDFITAALEHAPQAYVRNRLLRLKMIVARDAKEFYGAASRVPADSERGVTIADEDNKAAPVLIGFDDDFRLHVTRHFSLQHLLETRTLVPKEKKRWVSDLIWTRAVLLERYDVADAVMPDLMEGRESTHYLYKRFKKAASRQEKRIAAILILANTPELNPHASTEDNHLSRNYDFYKNPWNCSFEVYRSADKTGYEFPVFISPLERQRIAVEQKQLGRSPVRIEYLVPEVIKWARRHTKDADAPKALHFLVASTRLACQNRDGETSKAATDRKSALSREAFRLLHSTFRNSEWTRKTPYHY